jgi:signal transduction histidine kinase
MKNLSVCLTSLFIFFTIISPLCSNNRTDSLWGVYMNVGDDSLKLQALRNMSFELRSRDPDSAIVLAYLGIKKSEEIESKVMIASFYSVLGTNYSSNENYEKEKESYFKALEYLDKEKDGERLAPIYNNIGNAFDLQSDRKSTSEDNKSLLDSAQKYYQLAYQYYKKTRNKDKISIVLGNMGTLEFKLGNVEQALSYLREAYNIDMEYARYYLAFYKKSNEMSILYKANMMIEFNFLELQLENLLLLIEDDNEFAESLFGLGTVYYELGIFDKCEEYLLKSLKSSLEIKNPMIVKHSYIYLGKLYEKNNNYKKAYLNAKGQKKYLDTLHQRKIEERIADLGAVQENRLKDMEINNLEKLNGEQSRTNIALIIIAVLLIVIMIQLLIRMKAKVMVNTELKDLNATKDKFFSIIAHDLRNPIGNFKISLEVLSQEHDSFSREELTEFLSELNNSASSVFKLLENLLAWSRSQKGEIKLSPEQMDISYIINSNISLLKQMASQKNINLYSRLNEPYFAFYDNNTISTVIRNLISNAIKFTQVGGEICILAENINSELKISICDNGTGISEKDKEKLFKISEKFSTNGTSGEQGTGLGLILCQDFVEKNGGRIWAESEKGKGSKFIFTLPNPKNSL